MLSATESSVASTSPTIDLFLKLGFHGACCIYAIMAFLCAFWGAATIPDNRGKSLVKVEEFYENKTKQTNKMNTWKYMILVEIKTFGLVFTIRDVFIPAIATF